MRIGVLLKGVPFVSLHQIRIREDSLGLDLDDDEWSPNPFDLDALEWGVQLREWTGGEVVILTCGPPAMDPAIRNGLKRRADRATRIAVENPDALQPLAVAEFLAAAIAEEDFEIVLAGKEALDTNGNQLPQVLAELLGWPHATNAVELEPGSGRITVHRTLRPGEVEVIELELPAVVSVEGPPTKLRYPSLKDIMQGKKKTISVISLPDVANRAGRSPFPAVVVSRRLRSRSSGF